MSDRLLVRMIFIIVIFVFHHAECAATKQSAVTPSISTSEWAEHETMSSGLSIDTSTTTSAQTSTSTVQIAAAKATSTARGNGCSMGLVYGLIAACIVLLTCVILAIIIIIRMKGKIKYLQTINYSTHGGEVVQEFEMKTDDDLYDNLHDKKENANEYRDLHEKTPRKKDTNYKQPPKLPERLNPMDVIISPNSLVESMEAELKDIHQKYKVQGSNDDDTEDYPNLDALPETEELKMPTNDLKGSSAKTVKFDNSVTFYRNESEDINNEDVCEEKETESTEKVETEFTKQVDKIVTDDVDLPSYDDADVGEPGLYEAYDTENKLQKAKKGIKKVSMEDEYNDQEDDLYEPYDDSNGNNNGRDTYKTKIPKKPLNNKGNDNPAYDDEIIEESGYDESRTAEIDHKNTKRRDMRSNNAKPLQQKITRYDEDLYEVPVSSNFRDSGLPNFPAANVSKHSTLTMPLEKRLGNNLKADGGVLHTSREGLFDESIITKSVNENGESNQMIERSNAEITALGTYPVPPAVPKRKGGVAPKLSVSPNEDKVDINMKGVMEKNKTNTDISENISGNVLRNVGEDKFGFDFHDVPSIQPKTVPRRSHGSPFDQNQMDHLTKSSSFSSEA